MEWIADFCVAFLAAGAAALGIGGGAVLLLYLTAFAGVAQMAAQGMNLVFFLPVAAVAVVFHTRAGLIDYRAALCCGAAGILGVMAGFAAARAMDGIWLSRLFALLLLGLGLRELFCRAPEDGPGGTKGG
ncbi:MAG: TSUP family transporter [Oscillospiraceae bacterium]|nr:TSUP family transporter [Oscillospiraceae bacterium]